MEKITFTAPDTKETLEFYVLEQTTIAGTNYLLVAEDEKEDSDAYILRETGMSDESEATYEIVEDDQEIEAIAKVFSELIEDVDIEY